MQPTPSGRSRVLVVDDAPEIRQMLEALLGKESFDVMTVGEGEAALDRVTTWAPDVVVLDLVLPDLSGIEVCRRIHEVSGAFVLMLTSKDEEIDKVIGLSAGADDYLTKPFSARELVARVHALLRRTRVAAPIVTEASSGTDLSTVRVHGDIELDLEARELRVGGRLINATRIEFDLIATLMRRPRMVFTRRQLVDQVWGTDWYGDEHVVDVHLSNLRRKIGDTSADAGILVTVRGVGYRLGEPVRSS